MSNNDISQRFLFDNTDIRGELVGMESSFAQAVAAHQYPKPILKQLGELAAASILLSTTLKFEGVMTLQAKGDGALSLLMVECSDQKTFRVLARFDEEKVQGDSLKELLGEGTMVITVDPVKGNRYQGIVPLNKATLVECLEDYFAQSVQLPTKLWLASNGQSCAGMLLQSLPASAEVSVEARSAFWEHVSALANTVTDEELLELDNQTILTRLFHEEDVRLFDINDIVFSCNCSRQRSAKVIRSLAKAEIDSVIEEVGVVAMDCQFCSQQYRFNKDDVERLFAGEELKYH